MRVLVLCSALLLASCISSEEHEAQVAEEARVQALPLNQGGWRTVEDGVIKRCDGPVGIYTLYQNGIATVPNDEECKRP